MVDESINHRAGGTGELEESEDLKMNKVLRKIDAAMNEYYKVNGIEFNPFDDEEEEKAIEYAAKKLGMTVAAIIAELD